MNHGENTFTAPSEGKLPENDKWLNGFWLLARNGTLYIISNENELMPDAVDNTYRVLQNHLERYGDLSGLDLETHGLEIVPMANRLHSPMIGYYCR